MAPPKIYKSRYPEITPTDIDLVSYLFTNDANISDTHPIYIDALTGATRTYSDIKRRTKSLAAGLRSQGVQPNDVVALFSPNTIDYATIMYAVIGSGAIISPINAASTAVELQSQLTTSIAKYIVVHSTLMLTALKAVKSCSHAIKVIQADGLSPSADGTPTAELLATKTKPAPLHSLRAGAATTTPALMCFSSGTSGPPKGVLTTHSNLTSNLNQFRSHCPDQCHPGQTWISFLPFSHIYGLNYFIMQPMKFGCTAVVMTRFDLPLYLGLVEKYRVETLNLLPPVILGMVKSPLVSAQKHDLRCVKKMMSAAAPLGRELQGAIESKFKREWGTTVYVLQAWGLTETSPVCTTLPMGEGGGMWLGKRNGTVGNLTASMEARVVDAESMEDVPEGAAGEIWVRGPNVCLGYYRNEEATRNGFATDEEGRKWFRTGDVGTIDEDGFVTLLDRMKEMIKYKGFQVIPSELEAKLLEHGSVVDACVVGVNVASMATEVPVGFVVLKEQQGKDEKAKEVKAWLEAKIAGHKKLRGGLWVVDSVPKSPSGKILRRQLKAEWEKKVRESLEGAGTKL